MNSEIITALITLVGSAIGTVGGIFISSKLVNHRLEQLEKRLKCTIVLYRGHMSLRKRSRLQITELKT